MHSHYSKPTQISKLTRTLVAIPLLALLTLSSCTPPGPPRVNPRATKPLTAVFINPHQAGSYAHFTAGKNYPKTYSIYKNKSLLANTNSSNSKVIIDLGLQRGLLMNAGQVAMDYPISSGSSKHKTPAKSYQILEKLKADKRSSLYGKIIDAEGNTVKSGADSRKHADLIPEGGKFQGALMAYWMRISWDGIGMHRGRVPRYPASHGCIRTYKTAVPIVFNKTRVGTSVLVRP